MPTKTNQPYLDAIRGLNDSRPFAIAKCSSFPQIRVQYIRKQPWKPAQSTQVLELRDTKVEIMILRSDEYDRLDSK